MSKSRLPLPLLAKKRTTVLSARVTIASIPCQLPSIISYFCRSPDEFGISVQPMGGAHKKRPQEMLQHVSTQ